MWRIHKLWNRPLPVCIYETNAGWDPVIGGFPWQWDSNVELELFLLLAVTSCWTKSRSVGDLNAMTLMWRHYN